MCKHLLITIAIGGLIALMLGATGASGTTVRVGNLIVTGNGTFSPRALSRTKPTPVSLNVSGKVRTFGGTHPPAAGKIAIEGDKNIAFTTEGYPVCKSSRRQVRDPEAVKKACGDAILGKGSMSLSIEFPEQAPILTKSPLLLFNGGEKNGVTTLYVHAYLTQPITTEIVIPVEVHRVRNGRYGIRSVASIPMIAGGVGSVTGFSLLVNKKYSYRGKGVSVLTAKCTDGKLRNTVEAIFADGSGAKTKIDSTCTPKR
jgi:hypothetical protein